MPICEFMRMQRMGNECAFMNGICIYFYFYHSPPEADAPSAQYSFVDYRYPNLKLWYNGGAK